MKLIVIEKIQKKKILKKNKPIIETQERFKSEGYNAFTEQISKNSSSSNDDKKMQSIYSIETYDHGTSKYLACKKEEIKCNNVIKQYKNV